MNRLKFALNTLIRDVRSGELSVLALAVIVAVAALTAVGFFTDRVSQAVELQEAEVLAADLRLRSPRPIADEYFMEAARRRLRTARTISMVSVVFHGEQSQLVSLYMVGKGYPLRGRVRVADRPFGAGRATNDIPGRGEVWADSRLLSQLGAGVGARLEVGASEFTVARVLDYRPDQGSQFVDLAPALMMNIEDAEATGLLQPGSRVRYAALFAGERGRVDEFKAWLQGRKAEGERLQDVSEASPQIRASSERAGRFLNLSALASVLLAAIAVAMAARRYAQRHLDGVALMKCLGASQGFVLSISVYQLITLALACAVLGAAAGYVAQLGLAHLLRDLIRGELPPPTLQTVWLALVTSVAVLVGFALPQLLQLRRIAPLRVLRRDLQPPPLKFAVSYGLAAGAVLAMLFWLIRDTRLVAYVSAGLAATLFVLFGAGWLLVRALRPVRGTVGVAWRYGLANVARRGRESIIQVAAFGLGLMVLLLLALVRNDLLEEWRRSLPADIPNHFFINIPAHERAAFGEFLTERGVEEPELFPMIRARMTHINGQPVDALKFASDRGRNFAEREQNLSWAEKLQTGNRIVAGRWWSPEDRGKPLVSVATEYQEELGLRLGDELTFDVAGESLQVRIASFREVRWDSFTPNFFLVLAPGVLEDAMGTYMTSAYLGREQRAGLAELVQRFPSVSIFDVEALLKQVRELMDKAARAVQYVFLFTLLAGITVLLASIQSTREERRFESAILRTLGASRRVVLMGVAAEFVTLGLLAGTLAAVGATVSGEVVASRLFELEYATDWSVWVAGWGAGVLLVGLSGLFATRSVVNHPPVDTLRRNA